MLNLRTTSGAVDYLYRIAKFPTTVFQYAVFLNSVANSGDPFLLYEEGFMRKLIEELLRMANTSTFQSKHTKTNQCVTFIGFVQRAFAIGCITIARTKWALPRTAHTL